MEVRQEFFLHSRLIVRAPGRRQEFRRQEFRPLDAFWSTKNGPGMASLLKEMAGRRRLDLLTSKSK
jgi:hypothetical protein